MLVTIMRHGEAGSAVTDRERQLTANGEVEVRAGCERLAELCAGRDLPLPTAVYNSAWVRTRQTAAIACDTLGSPAATALDALLPGGDLPAVDAALAPLFDDSSHLLLISHQPMVSRLADHYFGERGRVPGLTPGGFVTVDLAVVAAGCGCVCFWALPPGFKAGA